MSTRKTVLAPHGPQGPRAAAPRAPRHVRNVLAPHPQAWAWVQPLLSETLPSVNVTS